MIRDTSPLISGLIDAFLFLETSGPDEVNPDSAVRCMENMSSSLMQLAPSDQIELRLALEKIAADSADQGYAEFVNALPDMVGLERPGDGT